MSRCLASIQRMKLPTHVSQAWNATKKLMIQLAENSWQTRPNIAHHIYQITNQNMSPSPLFRRHLALPLSSILLLLLFIGFSLLYNFVFCDIMFGSQKTKSLHGSCRLFSKRVINDSLPKDTYIIAISIYETHQVEFQKLSL